MRLFKLVVVSIVMLNGAAKSSELEKELKVDLASALKELNLQREKQAKERANLGGAVAEIESKLLVVRRQRELARLTSNGRRELLDTLKREKYELEQDSQYLKGVYRDLSVRIINQFLPDQKTTSSEALTKATEGQSALSDHSAVFDLAMDRIESVIGGEIHPARAALDSGEVLQGSVCNVGPLSWFLSEEGGESGVLMESKGAKYPRLLSDDSVEIASLFHGERALLQLDVTGGKARAIEQIQGNPSKLLKKGGVWLWPILAIALVSSFCGIIKFIELLRIKDPKKLWVSDVLAAVAEGDLERSRELTSLVSHPVGSLIHSAIDYIDAGADVVEEVVYEQLIGVQSKLQKWLPFIAVTAATAPLLGLLGTVSGMIRMFNVITVVGTGDVKPMAGGISEALVTTLFGLVVAIPALIIHTMLQRRSNGVVQNTEKLGLTFVNGLRRLK